MRVKVIKPWTIEGYTYSRIGEELEVEEQYALRGIYEGYAEDPTKNLHKVIGPQTRIKKGKEIENADN